MKADPVAAEAIGAVILAGGVPQQASALSLFRGYPLILHTLLRLAPQVGPIVISARDDLDAYRDLGHGLVCDDPARPLVSGILAAWAALATRYLLCVPAAATHVPINLAGKLCAALGASRSDIAIAASATGAHPLFCLLRRDARVALSACPALGADDFETWLTEQPVVRVEFAEGADAFALTPAEVDGAHDGANDGAHDGANDRACDGAGDGGAG